MLSLTDDYNKEHIDFCNLGDQWIKVEYYVKSLQENFHRFWNVKSQIPIKHIVIWFIKNQDYPKGAPSWSTDSVLQEEYKTEKELVIHHYLNHNKIAATIHKHRLLPQSLSLIKISGNYSV